jgi:phosphoserine phosphatase RsbU/P
MEAESPSVRVLLVDDDRYVLQSHLRVLSEYAPLRAEDGLAARELLMRTEVDVVVCDLGMPRLSGLDLMRWAKDECPGPLWIVVSGQDTFDAAAQALKLGAFDFLCKPILPIQLRTAVDKAATHQRLLKERATLVRGLADNNLKLAESLRELHAAYEVLHEQRSMLDQDLKRAERIMRALLPHSLPVVEGLKLNVGYRPSSVIGGDLYGAELLGDHHLALYVVDAAGHGVSAALLAVLFRQRLRLVESGAPRSPAAVLAELNQALFDECSASGLFVTVILALVDAAARTVTIASAGHPPGLLLRPTSAVRHLEKTGPALGLSPDATFEEHRLSLAAGDRLFFYTDGLTGALPELLRGGSAGLESLFFRATRAEATDSSRVIHGLLALIERSSEDDVTLLLVTAENGASTVDADRETTASGSPTECTLQVASVEGTTFVAVQGRAIWKHAPVLRDVCLQALDARAKTILDLGGCAMLDSTMLGTLHELVARADRARPLRIQNVSEELSSLFDELSMKRVLSSIVEEAEPLPSGMATVHVQGDAGAHGLVLRAHELLAELSPHNAEEFAPVIEALRREASPR